MMRGIDISNWQSGTNIPFTSVDFVICKATEGTGFVDAYCDGWVQSAKANGLCWGFYHFASSGGAVAEADWFIANCEGYFGEGVPVLDWEGGQPVQWVNDFARRVHDVTGVWPWVYGNPWRFNQGGVEDNCARWVAEYPNVASPTFDQAQTWLPSETNGNVVAWQFCSDGYVAGCGPLDCNLYYGDAASWALYAKGDRAQVPGENLPGTVHVLEDSDYKVTIEEK